MYMLPGGGWGAGWYNKQLPSKVKRESHKESCRKIPRRSLGKAILTTSSVQSLSHVRLFETLWTAAHQASVSITNSKSLLKLMSIELVMPSNHLILYCPLLLLSSVFPSIRIFSNESTSWVRWPNTGVSTSASVLLMYIQDWFPLGFTCLISLQSKGLSGVFSIATIQNHQSFSTQPSLWSNSHIHTWPLEKP